MKHTAIKANGHLCQIWASPIEDAPIYFEDYAHGWLAVKLAEIERLGIVEEISPFSHIRGNFLYLEKTCDMPVYVKAKKAAGEEVRFKTIRTQVKLGIRNFQRYCPE